MDIDYIDETRDKIERFELSIAGYILKLVGYKYFMEALKSIQQYWALSKLLPQEL